VIWLLEEKNSKLKAWTEQTELLEQKAISSQRLQTTQQNLWQGVKKSHPQYLSQVIETLPLLGPELHRVQALARQYPENRALQERLSFLQGDKNRIRFTQEAQREGSFFLETDIKMQNTVQMNEEDLRKFLYAIEEQEDRPLLLVKDFDLKKVKEKADETVFIVQAELIKRAP